MSSIHDSYPEQTRKLRNLSNYGLIKKHQGYLSLKTQLTKDNFICSSPKKFRFNKCLTIQSIGGQISISNFKGCPG